MVFKHNEQTFAVNELDQLAYEPWKHLENGELASFPELSPLRHEKIALLDGRQENFDNHLENANAVALNSISVVGFGDTISVSNGIGKMNEAVLSEHCKRPLVDDEECLLTSKRPKQLEPNVQLSSPVLVYNTQGSPSGEEDTHVHPTLVSNSFPTYFEGYHRSGDLDHSQEAHSTFLDYYPRKPVAIGPNHQAIIPERRFNDLKNCPTNTDDPASTLTAATSSSQDDIMVDEDDSGKLIGTCIMPMPDAASLASQGCVLQCKMHCTCPDVSSIRCVRQHIIEVREKLHNTLGHDSFVDLGFYNMGENVAEKWTEEEEHLFQEVVLANPASLGKNFWDYLPRAFPSRSSKDLVSYYFNVFMLRKRAEQNRFDPLNIDSDNDEWQESDDGEYATEEEDEEDSAVESPTDQVDICREKDNEGEVDVGEETEYEFEYEEYTVVKDNEGRISATAACPGNSPQNCVDEHEVQDDSCTSFEAQHNGVHFRGGSLDNMENHHGFTDGHENMPRNDGLSAIADHGFLEGHCGPKAWDITFTHGGQKDDFLSTCNVIEEVFGKEAWKSNSINSQGFSQF